MMILNTQNSGTRLGEKLRSGAFSLIEVVLAIGVFSLTILAVIGMLGSTSQATSEVVGTTTASLVADGVKAELEKMGHVNVEAATGGSGAKGAVGNTITLVATRDGGEVVLVPAGTSVDDTSLAIPVRDRFFQITLERLVGPMGYQPNNSHLAVSMVLVWPCILPTGPAPNDGVIVPPNRQSQSRYNMTVVLTE